MIIIEKIFTKPVNNKLRSRAGESISETLVALLISALALVMLAGAIGASSRIVTRSRTQLKKYYNGNEVLVTTPTQGEIDAEYRNKSDEIAVLLGSTYIDIKVKGDTGSIDRRQIDYYQNQAFTKNKVTAYKLSNPTTPAEPEP